MGGNWKSLGELAGQDATPTPSEGRGRGLGRNVDAV